MAVNFARLAAAFVNLLLDVKQRATRSAEKNGLGGKSCQGRHEHDIYAQRKRLRCNAF
jgi:hypothetical protein